MASGWSVRTEGTFSSALSSIRQRRAESRSNQVASARRSCRHRVAATWSSTVGLTLTGAWGHRGNGGVSGASSPRSQQASRVRSRATWWSAPMASADRLALRCIVVNMGFSLWRRRGSVGMPATLTRHRTWHGVGGAHRARVAARGSQPAVYPLTPARGGRGGSISGRHARGYRAPSPFFRLRNWDSGWKPGWLLTESVP